MPASGPQPQQSAMQAATRAALLAAADPFRARIAKHQATLDTEITSAKGDGRTVAALVRADLDGLKLDAQLAGRLSDGATSQANIMIVYPAAPPAPPAEDDAVVIDMRPGR